MMSDNAVIDDLDETEVPTSYSSSTPAAATNRPAIKAPGGGTGRRKEAVARVGEAWWRTRVARTDYLKNLNVIGKGKVYTRAELKAALKL